MDTSTPDSLELVFRAGFQRVVTLWLTLFSLVCAILVAVDPWWGAFSVRQVWLLILVHSALAILLLMPCTWRTGGGSRYIKERHPAIWQKLGPQGLFSRNSLVTLGFMWGVYDDGQDAVLQLLKRRYRRLVLLTLWLLALFCLPVPVMVLRELVLVFIRLV